MLMSDLHEAKEEGDSSHDSDEELEDQGPPPSLGGFQIPLPHRNRASGQGLNGIADALAKDGVLSVAVRDEVHRLVHAGMRLQAAKLLLREWTVADKQGRRIKDAPSVLVPDERKYPGLKPSTFRPDILKALFQSEQAEVVTFLVEGFVNGFRIVPEDMMLSESVTFRNIKIDDPSATEALNETTCTEAELGRIGERCDAKASPS